MEQRVLVTAANGMQVWIPMSRLDAWAEAQEEQRKNTQADSASRKALESKVSSALRKRNG